MSTPRAEWRRAPDFAEVAETLGVTTVDVCAMWSAGDGVICVLFTDQGAETTEDDCLISARLTRDSDGILRRKSPDLITETRVRDLMQGRKP